MHPPATGSRLGWALGAHLLRRPAAPQAFKFAVYVALPIGLTAAVVLNQDMLQRIIKSVSGAPPSLPGLPCSLLTPTLPPGAALVRDLPTQRRDGREDPGGERRRQRRRRSAGGAVGSVCGQERSCNADPRTPLRFPCAAAPSQGARPQVLRHRSACSDPRRFQERRGQLGLASEAAVVQLALFGRATAPPGSSSKQ